MIIECLQGSPEWLQLRAGKVTASRVAEAIAELKRKEGEAAVRKNYRADIVAEILTGRCQENFVSAPMTWGIEQEQFARAAYEMKTDCLVETVGIATHPTIQRFSCSPDGFIGKDGMVQFKCPNTVTHLDYLIGGVLPEEYRPQVLAELACCPERQWSDFASFDPRLPDYLQLFIVRLHRNNAEIAVLESKVQKFLDEVDILLGQLAMFGTGLNGDLTPILQASLAEVVAQRGIVP
jgi:YqaJ-like viral recombinase domain